MRARVSICVCLACLLLLLASCGAPAPVPPDDDPPPPNEEPPPTDDLGFTLLVPNLADGRIAVLDGGGAIAAIFVIDPADVTSGGAVAPVVTVQSSDLTLPSQGGFDGSQRFWVPNGTGSTLLRFDGLPGLPPSDDAVFRFADVVLQVDTDGGRYTQFSDLYDLYVDADDNVWTLNVDTDLVYRFDAADLFLGGPNLVSPALELGYAVDGSINSLTGVASLWVSDEGDLYVGNGVDQVSRFDDAASLTGVQELPADAYLNVGLGESASAAMVAIDDEGSLWIGYSNGELFRITDPGSYEGSENVRDDAALVLSWAEEGGPTGYEDGGNLAFVPDAGP